jgi:parvulin-like peptidyl-prolyl isomerase
MGIQVKITIVALTILSATLGCHSGVKQTTMNDKPQLTSDSTGGFVMAESPVFKVTADMMASQLETDDYPKETPVDSGTAWRTVYTIFLDTLLCQEGKKIDLAVADSLLYRQYQQLLLDRIMRVLYKKVILDSIKITDSIINAAYESNKESFKLPDMYRARHIVINGLNMKKTKDSAQYKGRSDAQLDSIARSRIGEFRERYLKGASFDTLAMMYSEDNGSADKGGDLGYFQSNSMPAPFDSVVIHTPVGKISDPFKTIFGWHIVKVEDYSPTHYQPLDSVRGDLFNQMQEKLAGERGKQYIDSARSAGVLKFDSAAISMPDSLHKQADPMAYANYKKFGNDTVYFRDYSASVYAYKRTKKITGDMTTEDKKDLIQTIAIRYFLMSAARKLGVPESQEVKSICDPIIDRYRTSYLKKRLMYDGYKPSEEEMRAYYNSHAAEYAVERPLYVQHIIFADSNLAEYVRDQLNSGADFMEMVDKYYPGDPDIKRSAADLGFIGPNEMPPAFWQTALSTAVGHTSNPVKTQYGFHLIRVVERKYAVDFESAKSKIEPILTRQHTDNIIRMSVESRLGKPPIIHWDRLKDIYRTVPAAKTPFIKDGK